MVAFIKSLAKNRQGESIELGRFWMVVLFTLMLAFSLFYHLPASWLISQSVVQKQIPKQWLIESVAGSVWNGEVAVSTHIMSKPGAILDLGLLKWDIDWLSLLKANLSSQQQWIVAKNSQIDFYIEKELLSAGEPLLLSGVQGRIDITQLIQSLSAAGLGTLTASGEIIATDVEMLLDPVSLWPQQINGQFEIRSLSTLGINLPILTAVPSMEGKTILLSLSAQEKGWQLKGRIGIKANRTYEITLSVKGDSVEDMPDWSQLMVRNSPTLATFVNKGRW